MTSRSWKLALVTLAAALTSSGVSPVGTTDVQAASPGLLAQLSGSCLRRPPGPPRFVTSTPITDDRGFADRTTLSWGVPVDVLFGTTCAPITAFQIYWAFQPSTGLLSCGPMTSNWQFHDVGVVSGGTLSKVLPSDTTFPRGRYMFTVRAGNQWGWGGWAPWTSAQCFDTTARFWP